MNDKQVRPYENKVDAFMAMIKSDLYKGINTAKDNLQVHRIKVAEIVREMQLHASDSKEYDNLRRELKMEQDTEERMEIALSVWNKVLKIYSNAESEFGKRQMKNKKEDEAA